MPKLKNHRGAKKRFDISGSGKIMRMHQGSSHLRRRKSKRVKAMYDEKEALNAADKRRISRLIPHVA